jgi:hypothetical protein
MPAALILDEEVERVMSHLPPPTFAPPSTSSNEHYSASAQAPASIHNSDCQTVISLKRDRQSEELCGECGLYTHSFHVDAATRLQIKSPLTVETAEVHRGRCLQYHAIDNCSPVHPVNKRPKNTQEHDGANPGFPPLDVKDSQMVLSQRKLPCPGNFTALVQSPNGDASNVLDSEDADIIDILTVMRQLPSDDRVQSKACERLWILTWDDECALAIGRVGGIPLVLQAMRRFPEHSHLQQCGCETLHNLAIHSYNCMEICQGGGVSLLVKAMSVRLWSSPPCSASRQMRQKL